MSNIVATIKMEMDISDGFLVDLIMTSLSLQFSHFVINYSNKKEV